MWFKTILCKFGIHFWTEWIKWKWNSYESQSQWKMQECRHCGIRRYKVIK